MRAINQYVGSPTKYAIADHLFLKLQGATPEAISESERLASDITAKHGGRDWTAAQGEAAQSMWNDRKNAAFASLLYGGPGVKAISTDVW